MTTVNIERRSDISALRACTPFAVHGSANEKDKKDKLGKIIMVWQNMDLVMRHRHAWPYEQPCFCLPQWAEGTHPGLLPRTALTGRSIAFLRLPRYSLRQPSLTFHFPLKALRCRTSRFHIGYYAVHLLLAVKSVDRL